MNAYARSRENQRLNPTAPDQPGKVEKMEDADARGNAERSQMSVIGADIVITGNIEASVDLHIEGRVNGDVRCATLILGESSTVTGRIYADRVRVSGKVDGAVETKDLAVEATAHVMGEVVYERLRVANGGIVEGNMKRKVPEEPAVDTSKLKLVEPKTDAKADAKPEAKSDAKPEALAVFIE